jgi:hypothetical protein
MRRLTRRAMKLSADAGPSHINLVEPSAIAAFVISRPS